MLFGQIICASPTTKSPSENCFFFWFWKFELHRVYVLSMTSTDQNHTLVMHWILWILHCQSPCLSTCFPLFIAFDFGLLVMPQICRYLLLYSLLYLLLDFLPCLSTSKRHLSDVLHSFYTAHYIQLLYSPLGTICVERMNKAFNPSYSQVLISVFVLPTLNLHH